MYDFFDSFLTIIFIIMFFLIFIDWYIGNKGRELVKDKVISLWIKVDDKKITTITSKEATLLANLLTPLRNDWKAIIYQILLYLILVVVNLYVLFFFSKNTYLEMEYVIKTTGFLGPVVFWAILITMVISPILTVISWHITSNLLMKNGHFKFIYIDDMVNFC